MNKFFLLGTLIIATMLFACEKPKTPTIDTLSPANGVLASYTFNGVQREFMLYKKANLPANAPLVFVMHGFTQTAEMFYGCGFNQIADTAQFMVCYPQGLEKSWKNSHNSVDVGFLKALAKSLQTEHSLNPNKTFATGFSQGGAMSNILATDAGDVFRAIAPVAGYFDKSVWEVPFTPVMKVPYFAIHGTDDPIIPINGNSGFSGWQGGPPIQTIVDYWKTQNNCSTSNTVQLTSNTTAYYHKNGINNNEVWYYKINGQSHSWPSPANSAINGYFGDVAGFNACQEIWKFFRKW